MFFDRWYDVFRVLAMGAMAYTSLIVVLRVSGKRTLAKLNAFDLVVTVSLGSVLATILLSSEVSLAEGLAALVVLCAAQFLVAQLSTNFRAVRRAVKSEPVLLVRAGEILHEATARSRLTEEEIRQAIRASGSGALEDIGAVVLETDGTMSVIEASSVGSGSALLDVDDQWRSAQADDRSTAR